MEKTQAGEIREFGYINGMNKKGFNGARSLSELFANSLDASSSIIKVVIKGECIHIIDNGNGMDIEKQIDLWAAQKENHMGEKSTGVSGFGAKPSTKVLSQDTWVKFYSKKEGADYCKSFASWDKIIKEGKYTGMIDVSLMDQGEIEMFKEFLGDQTGTIITFPKSPFLKNEIKKQFYDAKDIKKSNQRLDCIFPRWTDVTFQFHDVDENEKKDLEMYNYFGEDPSEYYAYRKITIVVFKDNKGDPIYAKVEGDGYMIYERVNKNWRKKPWVVGRRIFKEVGTIEVTSALRKDKNYFDPNGTIYPGGCAKLHAYESKFFSEHEEEVKADLFYPSILRNDQYIGNLEPLPKLRPSSGRSGGESCLKNLLIRTEMSYETYSSQDNVMDGIIGIQENKNQLNTYQISDSLKKHIEDNIKDAADDTWNYFTKKIEENVKAIREAQEKARKEAEEAEKARKEAEEAEKAKEDEGDEEDDEGDEGDEGGLSGEETEELSEDEEDDDDEVEEDDDKGKDDDDVEGDDDEVEEDEIQEEDQEDSKSLQSIVSGILPSIESVINNLPEIKKEDVKKYLIKSIEGL